MPLLRNNNLILGLKDRLEDEIQTHNDLETQENIEAGMAPEQAKQAAMPP